MHNIPYLEIDESTWARGIGGDKENYYESAKALLNWEFLSWSHPLGFSLLLVPFVWILKPGIIYEIIKPIVALQSIGFYILATFFVYLLAKKFLIKRYKALIVSLFFVIYPYFFYFFFHFFAQDSGIIQTFKMTRFTQLMFLSLLSDPLSIILMLGSLLLILNIYKKDSIKLALFLGVITSWAAITRMQNVIIAPIYSIIFLFFRKFKNLTYFIIGLIPLGLFQLYANYKGSGSISGTVYNEEWKSDLGVPIISLKYPFKIIEYSINYSPLFLILLGLIILLVILGIHKLIQEHRAEGIILASYFFSILLFLSFIVISFLNPRYFLPIIPVLFILMYAGTEKIVLLIINKFR